MRIASFLRYMLISLLFAAIVYLPLTIHAQQPTNDVAQALYIVAQINTWRVESGLWPLSVNPTLETMALAQASYVYPSLNNIQDESQYHYDAKQRNPRDRGVVAGWPYYNNNTIQIEIGENAGEGSATFVMNFWHSSPIHAKASLSKTYREIGVAALPLPRGGHFYIVVFGARPNVLPFGVMPDGKSLWLSNEYSRYAANQTVTSVRLLDAAGKSLTGDLPWAPIIPLPAGAAGNNVQVVFTTGTSQIISSLQNGAFIGSNMLVPTALPTTVAALPSPTSTATLTPTVVVQVPTSASMPSVPTTPSPSPTAVIVATVLVPTAPPLPTVDPAKADLVITYDSNVFVLRNVTNKPVDISGLAMVGDNVAIGMSVWLGVADFPAYAFPPSHCISAERGFVNAAMPKQCKWMRSILNLPPAKAFWTLGDFIVSLDGSPLATCKAADGQCIVDLP